MAVASIDPQALPADRAAARPAPSTATDRTCPAPPPSAMNRIPSSAGNDPPQLLGTDPHHHPRPQLEHLAIGVERPEPASGM